LASSGAVNLLHNGNVTANFGLYASGTSVTLSSAGNVNANLPGIFVSTGAGNLALSHAGNVTSAANSGIQAVSISGAVSVTSVGALQPSFLRSPLRPT
jgi:hypothetical protein